MPLKEYTCNCGFIGDYLDKYNEKPNRECPECGRLLKVSEVSLFSIKSSDEKVDTYSEKKRIDYVVGKESDRLKPVYNKMFEKKNEILFNSIKDNKITKATAFNEERSEYVPVESDALASEIYLKHKIINDNGFKKEINSIKGHMNADDEIINSYNKEKEFIENS